MRRSISPYRKEAPVTLIVSLAGEFRGVTGAGRRKNIHWELFFAQPRKRGSREFRGAAAAGGRIDDDEESFHWNSSELETIKPYQRPVS